MQRSAHIKPGYDHFANPCGKNGCGTRPGASHGRHGDQWHYVIIDDDKQEALELVVFTGWLCGVHEWPDLKPSGANIALHATAPHTEEAIREGETPHDCEFLGMCFMSEGSALDADAFFAEHGADAFVQTEDFWKKLEQKFVSMRDAFRRTRPGLRVKQCECCRGKGLLPVSPGEHA